MSTKQKPTLSDKDKKPKKKINRGRNNGKMGQPTKYKEEYCEMLIEYMSDGKGYVSFAGSLNSHPQVLDDWCGRHPEFAEAKKIAFAKCYIWWEKAGMEGMFMGGSDNPFQSKVWSFNMKNRFKWAENIKQEVDHNVTLENILDDSFKE